MMSIWVHLRLNGAARLSAVLLAACITTAACGSSSKAPATGARAPATTSTSSSSAAASSSGGASGGAAGVGTSATGATGPYALLKNPTFQHALASFSTCMRGVGVVEFPRPNFSGHGNIFDLSGIDTTSHKFETAMNTCRSELSAIYSLGFSRGR
jgi:hypothetical protein